MFEEFSAYDVTYKTVLGKSLPMLLLPPLRRVSQAAPVVYCIHGGGWEALARFDGVDFALPYLRALSGEGYFIASVEYRMTGEAGVRFPEVFADVLDGALWLSDHSGELGIDPHNMTVNGASAGGHLALMLGVASPHFLPPGRRGAFTVRGVVDFCGHTDFSDLTGYRDTPESAYALDAIGRLVGEHPVGGEREKLQKASALWYLSAAAPPILMIHGDDDDMVPLHQTELLLEKAATCGADARLICLHNAWHSLESRDPARPAVPTLSEALGMAVEFTKSCCEKPRKTV